MSDSEEKYKGDEIPSGNKSVDGNDIGDDEDCYLNVGIGRHSANYTRRFEDTQNLPDETWSNQSLPYNELPFTRNVEPKNIPDTVKTPGDIFLMLLSTENIKFMFQQTNLYYQQNKNKNDVLVTAEEMKKFIRVNIMMGIKRLPSYRDYWSSNPQLNDAYINSSMPVKRFSFLLSNLHLNDQTKEAKKGDSNFDKLYKIRPFIEKISETYLHYYDPTREQSIDESMVKFKGRSTMKQYMPQKPIKQGYKVWVRSDMNGYVCEFQIYTREIANVAEKNLGERVIKNLSQTLKNKNYHIYFDNYFTSSDLMITLLKDGISACGKIRKDRKGLLQNQGKEKDIKMGDSEYRTSYERIRWLKWIDKKPVQFLSNFHDPSALSEVERRQKDG